MFLNVEQLEKQLDKEDFQETGSMDAFNVLETQFQMIIKSRVYLNDEYVAMTRIYFIQFTQHAILKLRDTLIQHLESVKKSIDERVQLKREYDSWVNERQMQTTEEKDTSSRSGNDAHDDEADIRPIYDEEPLAEVVQNAEECHDTCLLPAIFTDNQIPEHSYQSLESENSCLTKTDAQFQKDFSRLEAHYVNLELKYQNQVLNKGQQSQFLKEKSNEAKVKHDIDVLVTTNIELEHKVAKLLKENETLKKHSELRIHDYNNEPSSSKLVPNVVPPACKTATTRQALELLFYHHTTMLRSTCPSPTAPTSVVRNMVGKGREISQGNLNGPASDATLREYCDKHYDQLLSILTDKMHQEKVQQEKLKAVKARLNFEEVSQHLESGTPSRKRDLGERLGSKRIRSMFGIPETRHDKSKSPRKRDPERKTVFKRLEKCVFHRLGDKEKKEHNLLLRNIITKEHPHVGRKRCQKVKTVQEDTKSKGPKSKDQALKMTIYHSHWGEVAGGNKERKKSLPPWKQQEAGHKQKFKKGGFENQQSLKNIVRTLLQQTPPENEKSNGSGHRPLIGFSGEIIWPLGQISLLVKIGDEKHSTSTWMNFVIVRSSSPYNEIIGRPGVRKIQAVPLTAHGILKFPVPGGIHTLKSSKIIPIECATVSGPEG
uniref:Reverse transcriptase domain-containing protein n=1 Tax=Tanacetum cinerariifolium TaxID=118510 RepID=A0A6L2JKV6_TANCI|nr:reverse transcriptase domain-containing protein [Tanacetum cinerariifolium]